MSRQRYRCVWVLSLLIFGCTIGEAFSQLKSRPADEWITRLERPERVNNLQVAEIVKRLNISAGQVVADIGAGSGLFSKQFADSVGPGGGVLAVEVDPGFLDHIRKWTKEEGITNIEPVLGEFEDPKLPRRDVDLAFFHDVLHHIEHREAYLKTLGGYLEKPDARVAIVDMIKGHPENPHVDEPELEVGLEELKKWMASAGFGEVQEIDLFERKYFVVFSRN